MKPPARKRLVPTAPGSFDSVLLEMIELLSAARRASARTLNAIMTATYWEMGRRIVAFEQGGRSRATYGEQLMERLSMDLTALFGRGFGLVQLNIMRQFYVAYPEILQSAIEECRPTVNPSEIRQSVIGRSGPPAAPAEIIQTVTKQSPSDVLRILCRLANVFPLSWTHYTRLLRVENPLARKFYESESLRSGWTVRQLDLELSSLDSRWLRGRAIRRDERPAVARTRLGRIRTEITHRGTS